MKFKKVIPKNPWSAAETQGRIDAMFEEMKSINQIMQDIDNKVSNLLEQKIILRRKMGNKQRYINQLKNQLVETQESDCVHDWEEVTEQTPFASIQTFTKCKRCGWILLNNGEQQST